MSIHETTGIRPRSRRRGREEERTARWRRVLIAAGLLFLVLVAAAVMLDSRRLARRREQPVRGVADDLARLVTEETGPLYVDARGLFAFPSPPGWTVVPYPQATGYSALFRSPNGPEIAVTATAGAFETIEDLLEHIRSIEVEYGLDMHIESVRFLDRPAVMRRVNLLHVQVVAFDFLEGEIAHHLQISLPRELAEAYEGLLIDYLRRYQPRSPPPPKP